MFIIMITNNIEKIVKLLDFKTDTFYYLEILKRKKDNSKIIKDRKIYQRFITSLKELREILEDIKILCKIYNARAYISLIPKSNEKFTKECLRAFTDKVCSNNYKNTFLIPEKIVLLPQCINSKEDKFWILDVDEKDKDYVTEFKKCIEKKLTNIYEILNTPNGYHFVVDTFNLRRNDLIDLQEDNYKFDKFEFTLRKEALTVLYADIT